LGHNGRYPLHGAAGATAETIGWPEEKLVDIVTKESMIGVARL
jgi:hypothetical protein